MKNPHTVILKKYTTEKSALLSKLYERASNKSLSRFKSPKAVFIVDPAANKKEIADAIEAIYAEQKIKVLKVNTLWTKPKQKQRGRMRRGATEALKKAIVTLEPGDTLGEIHEKTS